MIEAMPAWSPDGQLITYVTWTNRGGSLNKVRTAGTAKPEPDAQLEPVVVRLDDAIRMCLDGTIRDAKTVTSLLLWERSVRGK